MTLVGTFSIKGSPGSSSSALVLASVWPRPAVLIEADPAGGDSALRCRAATGGVIAPHRGILRLAAGLRSAAPGPDILLQESQLLACGVNLVQGVTSPSQARAIGGTWDTLARVCRTASVDVIADLGRLDQTSPSLPVAQHADVLLPVASATLASVMHLLDGLPDILGAVTRQGRVEVRPALIGPAAHADRDIADLDGLLARAALATHPAASIPYDPKSLARLESGERPTGRLARTMLVVAARRIADMIVGASGAGPSPAHTDGTILKDAYDRSTPEPTATPDAIPAQGRWAR